MVGSRIGSNFHRRSGDDERRGIFSKLPPLSIPNSLRRLTSNSPQQESKDSASFKSTSTSSAVVAIGSVLAQIPSRQSGINSYPKSSRNSSTPASALPLSVFSPATSSRSSADTDLTTPGSGPPGTIAFAIRPGILPDPSPGSPPKVISWEQRLSNGQHAVNGSPVLVQRSSKPSIDAKESVVFDATLNRVEADSDLSDPEIPTQGLKGLNVNGQGPKGKTASRKKSSKERIQGTSINWDPSNPGHDTWNETGRDEKWQQRSQLFSSLSAFNMRNAQKRKNPTPKIDVGPGGEAVDPTNDPLTPRDVGGLVENGGYFDAAEESNLKRKSVSLPKTPHNSLASNAEQDASMDKNVKSPETTTPSTSQSKPRITVALPCSDIVTIPEEDVLKDQRQQSLFDLSEYGNSTYSSEEDEDEDEEQEEDSHPHSDDEDQDQPSRPSNEISISIASRTAHDSTACASLLRRTSSTPAARSRGESIGLADCSQDPMVLAAGFEKGSRNRAATDVRKSKRETFVYRASGNVGREVWEVCPGREALALGVERRGKRVGRNRGETV